MKRISKSLITAVSLLSLSALAAPQLSPQSIIVNPVPTDLNVQTWVDRDPSGYGNSVYRIGENIRIFVNVNDDAYVYLFNINADGKIDLILPNGYNANNYLRAGETRSFPEGGARYQFNISGPVGVDQVLAVASRQPLSLSQIADIRSGQMRVQGAGNLARALSIVVTPLPQQDWVSDTVRYSVSGYAVQPAPQPPTVYPNPIPSYGYRFIAPLPGGQVLWEDRQRNEYSIAYRAPERDVERIFSYYHKNLEAQGWVKREFKAKGKHKSDYWAEYRRGGERAELWVTPRNGQVEVVFEWND